MRRIGPLLMSTILVTGCAGLATNNESLRVILERNSQSQPQPKLSAYDQGKRHLQLGRAGLAIAAFEQALKESPNSVPVLNGLAVAYDRLGRGDVAQRYLDRALSVDPNSAVTLNNLAYLNLVQGNTAVALAYAERAKIAADMPMDMVLPDTIANAVERTAQIATQIAANESEERTVARNAILPPESDVKRVGLNEWQLRIRPPNPADAVRINLSARDAEPRVIEPMTRPVVTPTAMEPLTAPVVVADVPDAIMADLLAPMPEPASEPTVVASLPQAALAEPSSDAPASGILAPAAGGVSDAVAPVSALPASPPVEPVATQTQALVNSEPVETFLRPSVMPEPVIASLLEPPVAPAQPADQEAVAALPARQSVPVYAPPVAAAIAAVPPAIPPTLPPQQMPEPAQLEPVVAVLPARPSLPVFASPAIAAIAAMPPAMSPTLPPQQLPEPAQFEPVVAALPARPSLPAFAPPAVAAIADMPPAISPKLLPQQLPEPVQLEQIAALLPVSEPLPPDAVIAALYPPEPVRPATPFSAPAAEDIDVPSPAGVTEATAHLKEMLASLSAPPSQPAVLTGPPAKPAEPIAPVSAIARPAAPMVASVSPPPAAASRAETPMAITSGWRASVPVSTEIRVSNGTGRRLMAGRFARYFGEHGLTVRRIANANSFDYRRTVIFYNPDQREHAEALARVLPFPVRLAEAKQGRGQIELVLGFDLLGVDDSLRSS